MESDNSPLGGSRVRSMQTLGGDHPEVLYHGYATPAKEVPTNPDDLDTPTAACAIVLRAGKVLSVARKENAADFALPGGKVEPGEEPKAAAARELVEETGVGASSLTLVHTIDDGEHVCAYYLVNTGGGYPENREGQEVRWLDPSRLFVGRFGRVNREVFTKLEQIGVWSPREE